MTVFHICTINFLHHMAAGMVLPVLPRHIMNHGGNQFMIGVMYSLVYIFQQLHHDIFEMLPYGKWYSLKVSLYCPLLALFVLLFHQTLLVTMMVRCFYSLTTDCATHSKQYVETIELEHKKIRIMNMVDIMKTVGLAVGSICGGYLYPVKDSYAVNAMVASFLTLTSLVEFLQRDPPGTRSPEYRFRFFSLPSLCRQRLRTLLTVELKDKRSFFVLKEVYIFSILMYLPRWVYIVNFNYYVSCSRIGYAQAMEQLVLFSSLCIVPFSKNHFKNQTRLLEHVMIICGFLLVGLFYAPTYTCHLLFFAAVICMNTLANSLLEDDAFGFKTSEQVDEASKTVTAITNICVPIFAGSICHYFDGSVLKLVALLPIGFYFKIISENLLQMK